ncbi:MAG: 3-mercaptopyruvate sulfurtransferase [Rhizobiales bacterium]|nr:3-mercaptopyruvate sulfurtransferase [Hyphomicrobiales bacterium]
MTDGGNRWLVGTDWVASHLAAPDVVIVDASTYMPAAKRNGYQEFLAERIPGAVYFDVDAIADRSVDLPHMLPDPRAFSLAMRRLGIGDGMRIVVYDKENYLGAARVWWTFRVMGVEDVVILDGGLGKWKAEGRPLEDGPPAKRAERHFTARRRAGLVRDLGDMREVAESRSALVVDARSRERFAGTAPEPRQVARLGHIPGSSNLPFNEVIGADGRFRPVDEIRAAMAGIGVEPGRPVIATCGSGLTACVLAFAMALAGREDVAVYDGSWVEWGNTPDVPIDTGPA